MALKVAELFAKLGVDMDDYKKGMEQSRKDLDSFAKSAGKSFKGIAQEAKTSLKLVGVAFATMLAGATGFGLKFNADMEQTEVAFTTLLRSAEKAKDMIRDLQVMAAKTPYEFSGLKDSARLLLAMGFTAEQVKPALMTLGDTVAAIGGNQETLQGVTLAIGQMLTKGKVSAEEMNQLAERGVAAWDLMATNMGKSKAELMQLAAQGKLLASQGLPALLSGMADRYAGAMQKQATTFNGLMSNLRDNVKMALGQTTQGLFEAVKDDAQKLLDTMQQMQADGSLQEWGQRIGDGLVQGFNTLKAVGTEIIDIGREIVEHWNVIGPTLVGVASGFAAMKVIGTITILWKAYKTAAQAAAVANTTLLATLGPIRIALVAVSALMGIVAASTDMFGATAKSASEETFKFANSVEELNKKLSANPLERTTDDVQNLQADIKTINELLKKQDDLQTAIATSQAKLASGDFTNLQGQMLETNAVVGAATAQINQIKEALAKFDIKGPEDAKRVLSELNAKLNESVNALLKLKSSEINEIAAKRQSVNESKNLLSTYQKLSGLQKLDAAQKQTLTSVVQQLTNKYPAIRSEMDKEGKLHIINIDLLNDRIRTEDAWVTSSAEGLKTYLSNLRASTQAQASQIEAQINNLKQLGKAIDAIGGKTPTWFDKLPDGVKDVAGKLGDIGKWIADGVVDSKAKELETSLNGTKVALNDIDEALNSINNGKKEDPFAGIGADSGAVSGKKEKAAKDTGPTPEELRREAFDAEMEMVQFQAEMYDWSANKQIAALQNVQAHHKQFLKENVDEEHNILLQIKDLREQSAKATYDASVNWINKGKEFNRLTLEQELAAWQRVQARYKEGSEERFEAESNIYRVQQEIYKKGFDDSMSWIDDRKYYNELSLDQELAAYERMLARYKKGTEEYKKLAREIYRVENEITQKRSENWEKSVEAALKVAKANLQTNLNGITDKIAKVNESAKSQTDSLKSAIDGVNDALKAELKILDDQMRALDDAKTGEDRAKETEEYNAREKALLDQRLWYSMQGEEAHAEEIAGIDRQLADERKAWAETQRQWQYDDRKQQLQDAKDAAQERAEVQKTELQNRIDAVEQWRDYQVQALEAERDRLQAFWDDEEAGVKAIMENGLLDTISKMEEQDPAFKNRGDALVQNVIDGINGKKGELQKAMDELNAMMAQASSAASSLNAAKSNASAAGSAGSLNKATAPATIGGGASGVGAAVADAVKASMPKTITVISQLDGETIATNSVALMGNAARQATR